MGQLDTQQKLTACLEFMDDRLEDTSQQTIRIAEMIIDDIKELTRAYPQALKNGELHAHSERVRQTQMNWVNQLHDIILEQTNRDLNGQVILSLQNFVNNLNQNTIKQTPFEMPSSVAHKNSNETEYLNQDKIEGLMTRPSSEPSAVRH